MANVLNKFGRYYTFDVADLISTVPITIRKVVYRPAGETNTAVLHTCDTSATPDCDAELLGATVASTSQITAASGTPFNGAAQGDWLQITDCNTSADDGWYYIKTYTSTTVIVVEKGINALTDGSGTVNMHIKIWSPEPVMNLLAQDMGVTVNNVIHELDWGDKGRTFSNLSLYSISSADDSVDIYVA